MARRNDSKRIRYPSKVLLEEGFFEFSKRPKLGKCAVKWCRKDARKDRCLCQKHYMRRWRAKNPERAYYENLRGRARGRGVLFTLTFQEFMSVMGSHFNETGRLLLTVDRIDATRGYEAGNIQPLSSSDNVAKGNVERHENSKSVANEWWEIEGEQLPF